MSQSGARTTRWAVRLLVTILAVALLLFLARTGQEWARWQDEHLRIVPYRPTPR